MESQKIMNDQLIFDFPTSKIYLKEDFYVTESNSEVFNYLDSPIEVKTSKSVCLEKEISTPLRVRYDTVEQVDIKASHSITCFFRWAKQLVEIRMGSKVVGKVMLQMKTSLLGLGGELRGKVIKQEPSYEIYLYPGKYSVSVEEQSFWSLAVAPRSSKG